MLKTQEERKLAAFIAFGSAFISVFLLTNPVTDPVNAPKLFGLGVVSTGAFSLVFSRVWKIWFKQNRILSYSALAFIISIFWAAFQSSSPFVQNIFGDYGRNTGLVTYLMLLLVLLSTTALRSDKSFKLLVLGILTAGSLNVIYCGWVLLFGDFIGWSNPYGEILGTFVNPDFISAFLGMFIAAAFAQVFNQHLARQWRFLLVVLIPVASLEIMKSKAIQGIVVAAGGVAIVIFFLIKGYIKRQVWTYVYVSMVAMLGIFSVLGALQKGPLAHYIYKVSVSLRGEYWAAGVKMGLNHPFTGIGMDSFGDWYRRARDAGAMILPGPKVVSNAAHNVVIDVFAYGGFPLLISYVVILVLGTLAVLKVIAREKNFNATFTAIAAIWICYEVQSIISINQIGLAIWGWVFCGALIAYEKSTRNSADSLDFKKIENLRSTKLKSSEALISTSVILGIGMLIGALVSVPPMASDMKWRSALVSQDVNQVVLALRPSFMNPASSYKYASAVQLFEDSKIPDKAHFYALAGVKFNPQNFNAWRMLYFASASTDKERNLAVRMMKQLDPLNTNVTEIG